MFCFKCAVLMLLCNPGAGLAADRGLDPEIDLLHGLLQRQAHHKNTVRCKTVTYLP